MTRRRSPWARIGWDVWWLGVEASSVIGLRALKIGRGGPAAAAETQRMVAEKVDAGLALQTQALTGGLGLTPQTVAMKTLTHYRRKVRANHRRLLKE